MEAENNRACNHYFNGNSSRSQTNYIIILRWKGLFCFLRPTLWWNIVRDRLTFSGQLTADALLSNWLQPKEFSLTYRGNWKSKGTYWWVFEWYNKVWIQISKIEVHCNAMINTGYCFVWHFLPKSVATIVKMPSMHAYPYTSLNKQRKT